MALGLTLFTANLRAYANRTNYFCSPLNVLLGLCDDVAALFAAAIQTTTSNEHLT